MTDLAVAFTVSGQREEYLQKSLESWLRVRGVQDAYMLFCVEPWARFPILDFRDWAAKHFTYSEVLQNGETYGCLKNTREAFGRSFERGASFAIVAEEDIEVAPDILEYFRWAQKEYQDEQDVTMVCAHAKDALDVTRAAVVRMPWFNPLVSGTWRDRWDLFVRPQWKGFSAGEWDRDNQAWDTNLRELIRTSGRSSIFPARSRSMHIGELSTWMPPMLAAHIYDSSRSDCFVGDCPPQSYYEVPWTDIPGLLV